MIDLANEVIRETYRSDCILPNRAVRSSFEQARRFILDADMSEMMGHLSTTPYELSKPKDRGKVLVSQRRSARLPFEKIFVQYDGVAFRRGLLAAVGDKKDLWGKELLPAGDGIIDPVGWLMECSRASDGDVVMVSEYMIDEGHAITLPFAWCYVTNNANLEEGEDPFAARTGPYYPFGDFDVPAAQLAHGVTGFRDTGCAVMYLHPQGKNGLKRSEIVDVRDDNDKLIFQTHYLVAECGGALRYIYAFLNMLNEVPVSIERPRRTAAYLANGKRRVAVDTQTIRLILPNRTITYREYARQLSRGVVKRAAHPVRGHWRVYGAHSCGEHEQHDWGVADQTGHADCQRCTASRTWINDYSTKGPQETGPKVYSVGAR